MNSIKIPAMTEELKNNENNNDSCTFDEDFDETNDSENSTDSDTYDDDKMRYKSSDNYIIELEIPIGSKTNESRKNIINKDHAWFRSERALVKKIYHKITKKNVFGIQSDSNPRFVYIVGKIIEIKDFDDNCDNIDTTGIHYFLTKESAFFYNFIIPKQYTGKYNQFSENGRKNHTVEYIEGKKNGYELKLFDNGLIMYDGNWDKGRRIGRHVEWTLDNKKKIETNWMVSIDDDVEEKKCGIEIIYYPDGKIKSEMNFLNGKKHGQCVKWFNDNTKKSEENWKYGKRQGIQIIWHEEIFNDDKLIKIFDNKCNNSKREKKYEGYWENGKENGLICWWYSNGEKLKEGLWEMGKRSGKHIWWHKNGNISDIGHWIPSGEEGNKHGIFQKWYCDGKKQYEENWSNGIKNGSTICWNMNGEKWKEEIWDNGKLLWENSNWEIVGK
jgi:antitoxin component YwqK of YwqJK toxin-antitoxin module